MSLFNWGNETPEQRAIRAKLEQDTLYEQAVRMSQARAGNAPGAAAGSGGNVNSTIPQSSARQTELLMVRSVDSNNWQYYIQDYDINYFIGPIDSTVSAEDYYLDNESIIAINQKGYACIFKGREDSNNYVLWFIDTKTRTVTTYSGYTSDLQYVYLGLSWLLVTDLDDSKMWYFDGETVGYDEEFLLNVVSLVPPLGTGDISSNGFGIRAITEVEERICIVNSGGPVVLLERDLTLEEDINYEFCLNDFSEKAVIIKWNNNTNLYEEISVYDVTEGTKDESLELNSVAGSPAMNFTDRNFSFFGQNQWNCVFYNSGDINVNYLVIFYNGYSNTLSYQLVDRNDYPDVSSYSNNISNSSYNDYTNSNCSAVVLKRSQGYSEGLEEVSACKILYVINGQGINTFDYKLPEVGSNLKLGADVSVGSRFLSVFTVGETGLRITSLFDDSTVEHTNCNVELNEIENPSQEMVGDRHLYYFTLISGGREVKVLSEIGDRLYELFIEEEPGYIDFYWDYDVLTIRTRSEEWYLNQATEDFTSIDRFTNNYGSQQHYDPSYFSQSAGVILQRNSLNIPYTHTQFAFEGEVSEAEDFAMDGVVILGTENNFGAGSRYFTNLYPGLFVLQAEGIDINTFKIGGDIGADGNGIVDNYTFAANVGGSNYKVFVKRVFGAGDPSINHIIILNGDANGATQSVDISSRFDTHVIFNIPSSVNKLHYLLMAQNDDSRIENVDIASIVTEYLAIVHNKGISTAILDLNANYENITGVLPARDGLSPRIYWFSDEPNDSNNGSINDGGDDMYDTGNIIDTNRSIDKWRIISRNRTISPQFEVEYDEFDTEVGPNFVAIANWRSNTETWWVDMFNLDGTLEYSIDTEKVDYENFDVVGDRASIHAYNKVFDGIDFYREFTSYMLTLNGVKKKSFRTSDDLSDFSYQFNDAPYID